MIIFKDLLDDRQEFFCDQSFKYEEDDVWIKVQVKQIVKPSDDMSNLDIGANPSAEGEDDDGCGGDAGSSAEKVYDICHYHKLEPCAAISGKKSLRMYLMGYLKAIQQKLKDEGNQEKLEEFKATAKNKLGELKEWIANNAEEMEVFVGEHFEFPEEDTKLKMYDVKQGAAFALWNEDNISLTFYFLKHGAVEEKV